MRRRVGSARTLKVVVTLAEYTRMVICPSSHLRLRHAVSAPLTPALTDQDGGSTPLTTAPMATTTDPRPARALEDVSGRRLRRMRWFGRAVALLFLLWFAAILAGGLGLGPVGRVPFGGALRPSGGPPPLRRLPPPRQPAPGDLVPALPAAAVPPPGARHSASARAAARQRQVARGRSAVAPGHLVATMHGKSSAAPGRLRTHGAVAPGRMRRTTTTTATTTTTTTMPGHRHASGSTR
jgi:hypothetical protein